MKFCTYTSTPGLDRYPMDARFRVWRDAHKQLMRTDKEYCRAVRRFRFRICASALFIALLDCVFPFPGRRVVHNPALVTVLIVISVGISLAYVFTVVRASFRMQYFQNDRVGQVLQGMN